MNNIKKHKKGKDERSWLTVIYKIVKEVNSSLNLKYCLKYIIDNAAKILNVERASLMLIDKKDKRLKIECAKGVSPEVIKKASVKIGEGVSGWVAKMGKPLLINDISKDPRFSPRGSGKYYNQSLLSVPLKARDEVIGVLNVNNKKRKQVFTKDDLHLLSALANEASIAVFNARLYNELLSANLRLKELDNLKSDFVANVSHELGTPLATCRYFTALMLDEKNGVSNPKQREYLRMMDSNIERLTHLINNLLSLSRIESGKFELRRSMIDVFEITVSVLRTCESLFVGKKVAVLNNIKGDLPKVYADGERITEVFINLIGNAVKFVQDNGKITLNADVIEKCIPPDKERKYLRVGVSDNGEGISSENLDRVFGKFEQIKKTEDLKQKGTGLGLTISREILKLHKGEIWAESEQGKGSTFFFTLPIYDEEEYFTERLSDETKHAQYNRSSLSLAILILKDFTKISKQCSEEDIIKILHDAEAVAKKTVRRPSDIVERFKKGEIIAILSDTGKEGAHIMANRVLNALMENKFSTSSGEIKLNFDIGVIVYPNDAPSVQAILKEMDRMLGKE